MDRKRWDKRAGSGRIGGEDGWDRRLGKEKDRRPGKCDMRLG